MEDANIAHKTNQVVNISCNCSRVRVNPEPVNSYMSGWGESNYGFCAYQQN